MASKPLWTCSVAACVALALVATFQPAHAQDADSLRQRYLIPLPPALPILPTVSQISPGSSSGSPTAFGPNLGDGFVGAGVQTRTRYGSGSFRDRVDGALVAGFGLGNSRDLLGLEVAITSFSTFDSGFLRRTGASFKVHRVLPGNLGVAVGAENLLSRGFVDGIESYYGVVSKMWSQGGLNPFNSVTASVGVGNGRFRMEEDVFADRRTVNLFGSVGVQILRPVALIADWSGQDLTLAASLVPFAGVPLIITPGLADLTGTAGDGARFILGAGMGFDFARLGRLFP